MDAAYLINELKLEPLPLEGGFFFESFRDPERTGNGKRSTSTAIYYLLTPETFSAMHRLPGAEIYHFYGGDPIEQLILLPDGSGEVRTIGADIPSGMRPQAIIPGGAWQGAQLKDGGEYALLGATMAPGFDFEDYEGGARDVLQKTYPEFASLIAELTIE